MKDEYLGSQKLVLVFCQTFACYDYEFFFETSFCQNCNFGKHFYGWAWYPLGILTLNVTQFYLLLEKPNMQGALMPKGEKCLQKQPKDNFFVISAYDI